MQGARDALEHYGTGLTGSRLLNGTIPLHLDLERELAEWMGTEEAIVFTTGHQANVGTLGTILAPGDTVIADSGDHASILDGCLLSRAKLRPFRHNRLDKLEKALGRAADDGGGVLVVVDGVFSMEGDVAQLPEIVELCEAHGARLMVDEAHGAGVLGARGAGASELFGVEDRVDLRMGTFSKSLASCGGFIAGSHEVIDYLRIQSRAFLFTAAAVPAAVGAALAALRVIRSADGPPLFAQVLDNARYLEDGLHALGYRVIRTPHHDADHPRAGRGRLEGRAALARALRRGRVRQRRAAPRRPPGRRAAAHERDGHPRPPDARPRARAPSRTSSSASRPSTGLCLGRPTALPMRRRLPPDRVARAPRRPTADRDPRNQVLQLQRAAGNAATTAADRGRPAVARALRRARAQGRSATRRCPAPALPAAGQRTLFKDLELTFGDWVALGDWFEDIGTSADHARRAARGRGQVGIVKRDKSGNYPTRSASSTTPCS